MELFLSLLYTSLFILLIFKLEFFNLIGLSRKSLSFLFIVKILSGISVWLVYSYYYKDRAANDIFKFFDDAEIMFGAIYEQPLHYLQMILGINTDAPFLKPYYVQMANWYKPWEGATYHNNRIIIQFNAFVYLFSFGNYHVHTVFMSFLSFVGLTGIYKTFSQFFTNKTLELIIAIFLVPSVLFWGSGLLKEGIILFGLGMLVYNFFRYLYFEKSLIGFIGILISSVILLFTKFYVFLAIFPSLLALPLINWRGGKNVFSTILFVHIILFALGVNLYRINPDWDMLKILSYKQWIFTTIAEEENAGSLIQTFVLKPNFVSFVQNMPEAIMNTLFRPHIFESKTAFMFVSALENLILMILVIVSIFFAKIPTKKELPYFYTSLFFAINLALIIGLVNPVLGSIVRFRIPLLPFFALFFIWMMDKDKLLQKFPFFKFTFARKLLNW